MTGSWVLVCDQHLGDQVLPLSGAEALLVSDFVSTHLLLSLSCRWLCSQTCDAGQGRGRETPSVWAKPRQKATGKGSLQALHKAGPLLPSITSCSPLPHTHPGLRNVSKDTGVCWFLASKSRVIREGKTTYIEGRNFSA